jgi:hypothetical protein
MVIGDINGAFDVLRSRLENFREPIDAAIALGNFRFYHEYLKNNAESLYYRPREAVGDTGDTTLSELYVGWQPKIWFFAHHHTRIDIIDPAMKTRFIGLPTMQEGIGILNTKTLDWDRINW